jgi:hypothetical protein
MATFDHPTTLRPESMEWGSLKRVITSKSPITGATETIEFPAERWQLSVTYPPLMVADAGLAEAFFSRVVGGVDRVRIYNFRRPVPLGTMRGSPTLAASVTRGDQQLQINTTGTLRAGDFFKIGGQLFQAMFDASPVGGVLTVQLVQRVRAPLAAGSAVTWDRPTALFVLPATSNRVSFSDAIMNRFTQDFDEVFA